MGLRQKIPNPNYPKQVMNKKSGSNNGGASVKVVREFNAAPEEVFEAWVDPDWLGRWMFGPDVREEEIIKLETDPRQGGTFSFAVRRDGEVINHIGSYLELDRPNRMVFTWSVEPDPGEDSVVTVEIVPLQDGCRLTLVHRLPPRWTDYADRTEAGWSLMLDKLKEISG